MIYRYRFLFILLLATVSPASAQQQDSPKKKIPTMTSDDVSVAPATTSEGGPALSGEVPAGWSRYVLDGCGLSIALPARPVTSELPISNAIRDVMVSARVHVYRGGAYRITITHMQSTAEIPLRDETEAYLRGLASSPGFTKANYTIDSDESTGRVIFKGSFSHNGTPQLLSGFGESRGKHSWFVIGIYAPRDNSGQEEAGKALASVNFDAPACPDR